MYGSLVLGEIWQLITDGFIIWVLYGSHELSRGPMDITREV